MYSVEYSKQSIRALRRMPTNTAALIRNKIESLALNPLAAPSVKKLSGRDEYRLRVGNWRVLYILDGQRFKVLIMDIGPRGGIYQ